MKSSAIPTDRMFRFGSFELLERQGVLRSNGVRIKLQELPMRVLIELLSDPGNLVSREDLQQKLWPADTFVDFDVGLNTAVRKIRQALGDDADDPRYIETTPKRGYRFLAPVEEIATETATAALAVPPLPLAPEPPSMPELASPRRAAAPVASHRRYFLVAALSGLAALAIVSITMEGRWHGATARMPAFEKRVTANPAEAPIVAAVVSPDGKYLAYSDTTGTYLRHIDSGETRSLPLPPDFKASPSSWFPDSTHLLLTARDRAEQKASLWKISILGGAPQMLVDDGENGVVSPDGSMLAYLHRSPAALFGLRGQPILHLVSELWLASASGQNPRKFAEPAGVDDPQWVGTEVTAVAWAPDSHRLAYLERHKAVAHSRSGDQIWLQTRDLAGSDSETVLRDRRISPDDLCWDRDGRILYVLRGNTPTPAGGDEVEAIRMDLDSGKAAGNPEPISTGLGWIGGLSVSEDGKRLLLWRGNALPQVFVSQFDNATQTLTAPRRLTLDENANQPTGWLPESQSVLILSNRNGAWRLYRQGADQSIAEPLVEGQNLQTASPRPYVDGKEILYAEVGGTEDPSAPVRLMRVPIAGGVPRRVLEDTAIDNFWCARSPATVCVYSKVVRRTTMLIAFDTRSGTRREIARFEGWPGWALSPDGEQLAVLIDQHQDRIQFLSLPTGETREVVLKDWPVNRSIAWSADGRSLLLTSSSPRGTSVILGVDRGGNARVLLENPPNAQLYGVFPSPDGRQMALNVITGEENVWMVENF